MLQQDASPAPHNPLLSPTPRPPAGRARGNGRQCIEIACSPTLPGGAAGAACAASESIIAKIVSVQGGGGSPTFTIDVGGFARLGNQFDSLPIGVSFAPRACTPASTYMIGGEIPVRAAASSAFTFQLPCVGGLFRFFRRRPPVYVLTLRGTVVR